MSEEITYGQRAVGLSFNPSNDPKVQEAKELCAKLIDLVVNSIVGDQSAFKADLNRRAVQDVVAAQMMAVKVLTWKE